MHHKNKVIPIVITRHTIRTDVLDEFMGNLAPGRSEILGRVRKTPMRILSSPGAKTVQTHTKGAPPIQHRKEQRAERGDPDNT